ncbi:MMPL family transporter [Cohnella sp. AR92]|uniref:MMPL family transporter n=1 Tax=Cohnella sp. AR92 TaxID=648716 RepID=UPI0026C27F02
MIRLSAWIFRRSGSIVLGWLLLLLIAGGYAGRLHEVLQGPGLTTNGLSEQAEKLRGVTGDAGGEPIILLFENGLGSPAASFKASVDNSLDRLPPLPGLVRLERKQPLAEAANGRYEAVMLSFRQAEHELGPILNRLRIWQAEQEKSAAGRIRITGQAAVQQDVNESSRLDIRQAERIGLPLAFLILCLTLRGVLPALIPIAAGLVSVVLASAILFGVGHGLELSVFVQSVVPMVGLALSIDFALLLVSRYREELRRLPAQEALAAAIGSAGRSIILSALCVLAGLGSTLWIRLPVFNSVAVSAMIVLMIAAIASLTLVPALLARMAWRAEPANADRRHRFWRLWGSWVLRRPIRLAVAGSFLFLLCVVPVIRLEVVIPNATSLPEEKESRQAAELLNEWFLPPSSTSIEVVAQSRHAALDEIERSEIERLYREAEQDSRVWFASPPSFKEGRKTATMSVWLRGQESSPEIAEWMEEMRNASNKVDLILAGKAVERQEIMGEIERGTWKAIPTLLLSNYLLLLIALRSLVIPFKAVLMNALTIGASFGIVAWVFREGRLGMPEEGVAVVVPVFVFGLAFGISMDYGVFLLMRIAEVYRSTRSNDRAILEGLVATGPVISSAAAIMTAVCLPFAWGDVAGVRQLGVGLTAAVVLDATLVRMLLVPAWMKLLGRLNWLL